MKAVYMLLASLAATGVALLLASCALEPLDPCNKTPQPPSTWAQIGQGFPHPIGGVVSVATVGSTSAACVTTGVTIQDDLNGTFTCDLYADGYGPCEPVGATAPVCVGYLDPADGGQRVGSVCVYF